MKWCRINNDRLNVELLVNYWPDYDDNTFCYLTVYSEETKTVSFDEFDDETEALNQALVKMDRFIETHGVIR